MAAGADVHVVAKFDDKTLNVRCESLFEALSEA
jgi:hypothetical protein